MKCVHKNLTYKLQHNLTNVSLIRQAHWGNRGVIASIVTLSRLGQTILK